MSEPTDGLPEFLDDADDFDVEAFAQEFENKDRENRPETGFGVEIPSSGSDIPEETEATSLPWLDADDQSGEQTTTETPPFSALTKENGIDDFDFEVSPAAILEGMLFVGNAENRPLTAEEMSSLMRGVTAEEIDDLVGQLNDSYRASKSPFEINFDDMGYRLGLARGYEFCRQRFYREEKAASLSQTVVDVLALVAYLQPISRKQIEEKKFKACGSILNQLVRRRLIQIERQKVDGKSSILYRTTDRFLDLFGLSSLDELPQSNSFDMPT